MDEFLESHIERDQVSYLGENDTYGKHLERTVNRRLYLGQLEESQILFLPKRVERDWRDTMHDLVPGVLSLWLFGFSLLYTYPRAIRLFKFAFPNVRSFILIHIGIAPMMMFVNLNLLGMFKGVSYYYFDWVTGGRKEGGVEQFFN